MSVVLQAAWLDDRRVYRGRTHTGFVVETYRRYGTHGSFLDYRRYFYGDTAEAQSRELYEVEKNRAWESA